ncbi:hypothetical protein M2244_000078 [Rhodoferax antarcticus]|nr:hypothetical protein [Rhodoferax antarcticus]
MAQPGLHPASAKAAVAGSRQPLPASRQIGGHDFSGR